MSDIYDFIPESARGAFRACCAKEDGRYQLTQPFVIDGMIYATDSRIVVRCRPISDLPNTGEMVPPCNDLRWNDEYEDTPAVIPDFQRFKFETGNVKAKCRLCDGTGKTECGECGHEKECEECEDGFTECEEDEPISIILGDGQKIGNNYLTKIVDFGGRIHLLKTPNSRHPLKIVGDGFDGLIMQRVD